MGRPRSYEVSMNGTPMPYREFLKTVGGTNSHGEPNFILMWGGDLIKKEKYPPQILPKMLACWVLAEWKEAHEYGPQEDWPEGADPYPYNGKYEILQVFRNGDVAATLDSPALNQNLLGQLLKTIYVHKGDSVTEKTSQLQKFKDRKDEQDAERTADMLQDAVPAFHAAESFSVSGQKNKTSFLKKKMEQIDRNYRLPKALRKGISIHKQEA